MAADLTFYLGTHRPTWLWTVTDVPLFISHRVLRDRVSRFPPATTPWALDSGGFTELNLYGKWETTPQQYVKSQGLDIYAEARASADSLAWSYRARCDARAGIRHCAKKTCANCLHFALSWRERVLRSVATRQHSLPLFGGAA